MTPERKAEIALNKQLSQKKHNLVNRAISATFHLLEDSFMYGTTLWPENGFKVGWHSEVENQITIGARVTDEYGCVVLNFRAPNYARISEQCKAIELILNYAVYDDIYFEYVRGGKHHIYGLGLYNPRVVTDTDQLIYEFKDKNDEQIR